MAPCTFTRSDKETLANVKKYESEKHVWIIGFPDANKDSSFFLIL